MQSLDECWEKKKKTKENFASRYHSSRDMVIAWQTLEFILHEWVLNLLFFSLRCLVMLRLSRTLSAFVYHRWAVVGADQLIVSSLYINISLKEKSCFCSRRRRRCFFNLWKATKYAKTSVQNIWDPEGKSCFA